MGKTMKRISLLEKPKTIFGKPFRIVDVDAEPVAEVYKCSQCGADVVVQKPQLILEASLPDLLKMLVMSIPRQACTMQDSINAYDFIQQLTETEDGVMKVTDGIHKWLEETAKKHGMAIFGVNTNAILTALDGFERAQEPKEKEEK